MRIAIVGAGAMGTLVGNGLCKAGHEVSILDLPHRVTQLRSNGRLVVVAPDGTIQRQAFTMLSSLRRNPRTCRPWPEGSPN